MTISFWVILTILLVHWIGDFVLQTDEQAKGKSSDNGYLSAHVVTYCLFWIMPAVFLVGPWAPLFVVGTGICHWVTDYYTSRLNTKLYRKGDIHNFFVSVGFDQILHYVQLFLTYLLLRSWGGV